MATEAVTQGKVIVHDFRGLLGTFGWGRLHTRFLVLEHPAVLVYASDEDWKQHREPIDCIALSADSTIETSEEAGETVLRLRSPDHTPFTFNAISHGTGALTSVTWNDTLERAIARLRRGVTVPETSLERSTKSWRLWRASSASVEDRSSRASSIMSLSASGLVSQDRTLRPLNCAAEASESRRKSLNDGLEGAEELPERTVRALTVVEEGREDVDKPRERIREGDECSSEANDEDILKGSGGLRRWPLLRGRPTRQLPNCGDEPKCDGRRADAGGASDEKTISFTASRDDRDGKNLAGMRSTLWSKAGEAFRVKRGMDCDCKWCRASGSRRVPWVRKWASPTSKTSAVMSRWENLVGRWTALQLARSGDTPGIQEFLRKFPRFPDKANLLRAAVRYKQYSVVQYFLDEQHMDVNLVNSIGIPLVWFSVLNAQKGDSGVMLRYLLQKGADIKAKSKLGQNVLFMVAFSRGKEAIPTLKYLVEEYGLSLTERDNFGSEPIHWAVLHGHLDTVQWISRYTRFRSTRANWAGVFQKMESVRLVKREHLGAVKSWRIRGVQKSARSLTPLGVAVLHNHEGIAKWLMGYGSEDTGCIKFKRDNLFREENRDLALVAKTWPELLPEVLQGFDVEDISSKSSWDTDDQRTGAPTGWSERIYDLKFLYGPPEVSAHRSPLSIFLNAGYPGLFDVKSVQMVVALKWSLFGQRYYMWELGRFVVLSLSYTMGFIVWGEFSNWHGEVYPGENAICLIGGTMCRLLCWGLTIFNLVVEEGRELNAAKSFKKYILDSWNIQAVAAYVLVLTLMAVFRPWSRHMEWVTDDGEYTTNSIVRRLVTAPAVLFLFTRFMEHLAVWKSTGIFITVIRMMFVDTASWAVIFVLFEVGFALAFHALLQGTEGFDSVFQTMFSVFTMSMGELSVPFGNDDTLHVVAVLMFVFFMLVVTIVYLNLLVAMMTNGYTKVESRATAQAMMNRAAALVKWEGIMSDRERRKAFNSVAPGKGKRAHITLKGWFEGGIAEVFCSQEGAIVVEPEKSSIDQPDHSNAAIMKELEGMREMLLKLSKRGVNPKDSEADSFQSSSDQEASFRRRQAGLLDANGNELSQLRITSTQNRRASRGSVTSEDTQMWRVRAREIEEQANSRRGTVRAQAIVRGYLSRAKSSAKFSS
ncbi:unnamed protein product [Ascophyllum nodosum]